MFIAKIVILNIFFLLFLQLCMYTIVKICFTIDPPVDCWLANQIPLGYGGNGPPGMGGLGFESRD